MNKIHCSLSLMYDYKIPQIIILYANILILCFVIVQCTKNDINVILK